MDEIIVLKFGTNSLMNGGNGLCEQVFESVMDQVIPFYREGKQFAFVTSGARMAGIDLLRERRIDHTLFSAAQLAGIGARHLLNLWDKWCWNKYRIVTSQLLLNYVNWRDAGERRSIRKNILEPLSKGVILLINQSDPTSEELPQDEMRLMLAGISDNDVLASLVARLIGAKRILFCTDVDYIYEKRPIAGEPLPQHYLEIDARNIPAHLREETGNGTNGKGGAGSKVVAAADCSLANIESVITKLCVEKRIIDRFLRKEVVGTLLGRETRLG